MAFGSVSQMIRNILQRAPSPGEVEAYQTGLNNGSLTTTGLANELIDGISGNREALDVVFPVLRFYQGVYGRVPDKGGLAYWVGVYRDIYSLDNPATPTQNEALVALARPFVDPVLTPEFLDRYGPAPTSYTGSEWEAYATNFIDKLYLNVLQRQADAVGLLYWTGEFLAKFAELRTAFLAQGRTEAEAALEARAIYIEQFTNSQEMKDATASVIRSFLTGAAQDPDPPNLYTGSLFNDPPVANPDSYDAVEDQTLVILVGSGVLANDIDPDYGQTLAASIVDNPPVGSLSFDANGSFSYVPAANYNGTVTFTYRVGDGLVLSAPATVTMTIASVFDPPVYSVAVSPSSVAEGNSGLGATLTYTITRVGDLDVSGSVLVAFSGTATQGADYTVTGLTAGAATFAAGAPTATVTVTTTPETVVEPDETVIATLGAITGGGTLGTAAVTGTIADDDTPPIYSAAVSPASVPEGQTGPGNSLTYTVARTGDVSQPGSVALAFSGTATQGVDYTVTGLTGGAAVFDAGASIAAVTVTTTPDTVVEPNETVIATLGAITGGGAVGTATATGTITNDDTPPIYSVAVSPASVLEGQSGFGNSLTYTVTRTGDVSQPGSVSLAFTGTATQDVDYTVTGLTGGAAVFAAGASTATVPVTTTPDTVVEPDETVIATLGAITGGGTIGTATATGTILNDDTVYSVSVSPSSVAEGNIGPGATLIYTLTRIGDLSEAASVALAFSGTATEGSDYTVTGLAGGAAVFAAGASTATVTLTTRPDAVVEPDETVIATLGAITGGGTVGTATATGTIINDDTVYSVSVSPSSVMEGNMGPGATLIYTVTRIGDLSEAASVALAFSGTATEGSDYTVTGLTGGTLVLFVGVSTVAVTLTTTPDTSLESDETVVATLGTVTGSGTVGTATATGTITNDDTVYNVSVSPSSVAEGNASFGATLTYTVTRIGDLSQAGSVALAFSGTATEGSDYTVTGLIGSAAVFDAGASTATVTVRTAPDTVREPDETVIATLGTVTGSGTVGTAAATGTITNDDTVYNVSVSPSSVAEGNASSGATLTYTVTRIGDLSQAGSVALAFSGTATEGSDYTVTGLIGSAAVFDAGASTATVTVTTTPDTVREPDETVIATLGAITGSGTVGTATATGTITNDDTFVIDLANLGTAGVQIEGPAANDVNGRSVSGAGDVNGDGIADILIGARLADPNGRDSAGATYVVFGRPLGTPWTDLNLANLGSAGVQIAGAAAGDWSGFSVSAAGDVNGDGLADLLIGAIYADPNGRGSAGATYVVFGRPSGTPWTDLDLANLGTAGIRIAGATASDGSGFSVSAAGDVNGDGVGDLLIGATGKSPSGRDSAGETYLLFGRPSGTPWTDLDLANLGTAGVRIAGATAFDGSGFSVSAAGDVNGDSLADVIIGARAADPNGRDVAGATYVVFGRPSGTPWTDLDLANLGTAGVRIAGATAFESSGFSVSAAGDVNSDGFGDFLIGAPTANPNGRDYAGATYVVFGRSSGTPWTDLDLANLGAAGFRIAGAAAFDASGSSVSAAGDFNGDGIADLLIGAWSSDRDGGDYAGATYVVFGRPSGTPWTDLDLANLGTAGVRIAGAAPFDTSGVSVSAAGDVNDDGFGDILIWAMGDPNVYDDVGATYVVFGGDYYGL